MGILEPITHSEEIDRLLREAEEIDQQSLRKFEHQKDDTSKSLEKLGKLKIKAWSNYMDSFVVNFNSFNSIEIIKNIDTNTYFIGCDESPREIMFHMQEGSATANEIVKMGVASVGTGALVGIASYGGVMMLGHASTGTAIAALSGAAKTNATLAWFGGGSKAAGGLGMAGGSAMIAGIVIVPMVVVAGVIANAQGKKKLAEAKKLHAEAEDVAEQRNYLVSGMHGIERMSDQYYDFIKKLSARFKPFIVELERIIEEHPVREGETIDFDTLSISEQKTLHLSWLMAQVYYSVLNQQIMTKDGKVTNQAKEILASANDSMSSFKKETYKLRGEEAKAGDIFWEQDARKMEFISFGLCALLGVIGILTMRTHFLASLKFFIAIIIAFPIFFKYTDLAESQKYTYRILRMIAAVLFVIIFTFIFR